MVRVVNQLGSWSGGYAVSSKSFEEGRASILAEYGVQSPQFASYSLEWSHSCEELAPDVLKSGNEEAVGIMADFCIGVEPLSDAEAVGIYKRTVRTELSLKLAEIEKAYGVNSALDFAESYIRNAQDPFAVRAGLDYLAQVDVLVPPDAMQHIRDKQRLYEIYHMARNSYICEQYGGCPANSPAAARFCLEINCSEITDYRRQVRGQLSPSELSAFHWYINAISVLRGQ